MSGAPPGPSGTRRLVSNSLWLVSAEMISKVASFALVVVLARHMGARSYGYFAFGLAFIPLWLNLARWGIDAVAIRELAADHDLISVVVVNGFLLRMGMAALGLVAGVAVVPLILHDHQAALAVGVLGGALWLDELSTFVSTIFEAFEQMRFNALILLVNRILSTALAVIAVAAGGGLVLVCVTYLVGSLGALGAGLVALGRVLPPVDRSARDRATMRRFLRQGGPYGLANFFNMGAFRIDSVLLEAMKGSTAVGLYNVAYRFFEPLLFAAWGLANASMPRLVRTARDGAPDRTLESVLAVLLAFYLPVAVGSPFAARWLLLELFGRQYTVTADAVVWLTFALAFYAIAHLARAALISLGRSTNIAWVAGGTLVTNVVVNLAVIPHYGYVGAAAVTFITELFEATMLLGLYLRRTGLRFRLRGPLLVPVGATAILGATLWAASLRGAGALLTSAVVYPLAVVALAPFLAPGETARIRSLLSARFGRSTVPSAPDPPVPGWTD